LTREVSLDDSKIPLYDFAGFRIGTISLARALELDGIDLALRAKGTGLRRRFTSARLFARKQLNWIVAPSGGFSVLQLINKANRKSKRR
jgi:hypothetical protein